MTQNQSDDNEDKSFNRDYRGTGLAKGNLNQHDANTQQGQADHKQRKPEITKIFRIWWKCVRNPKNSQGIVAIFTIITAVSTAFYVLVSIGLWNQAGGNFRDQQKP